MKQKVMVRMDYKIYKALRSLADKKNKDIGDFIEEAVLEYFLPKEPSLMRLLGAMKKERSQVSATFPTEFQITKNSLRKKAYRCIFHDKPLQFEAPVLRPSSHIIEYDEFDMPVYKETVKNYEYCDYSLLEIKICPFCGFASRYETYFETKNIKEQWETRFDPTSNERKAIIDSTQQRMDMLSKASDKLFTDERTIDDAIIATKVALFSIQKLHEVSIESKHSYQKYIMAQYHLSLARFYKRKQMEKEVLEEEEKAYKLLLEAHSKGLSGEAMCKTAFILETFAIKKDNPKLARSMWGFLNKAYMEGKDRALVNKYLVRVKNMYQDYALSKRSANTQEKENDG